MSGLTLAVEDSGSTIALRLAGELDLASVGGLLNALDRVDVERVAELVLDLHGLDFIDLAGLTTILRANERYEDHGLRVTVVEPHGSAKRVFTLTRAHRELELVT